MCVDSSFNREIIPPICERTIQHDCGLGIATVVLILKVQPAKLERIVECGRLVLATCVTISTHIVGKLNRGLPVEIQTKRFRNLLGRVRLATTSRAVQIDMETVRNILYNIVKVFAIDFIALVVVARFLCD